MNYNIDSSYEYGRISDHNAYATGSLASDGKSGGWDSYSGGVLTGSFSSLDDAAKAIACFDTAYFDSHDYTIVIGSQTIHISRVGTYSESRGTGRDVTAAEIQKVKDALVSAGYSGGATEVEDNSKHNGVYHDTNAKGKNSTDSKYNSYIENGYDLTSVKQTKDSSTVTSTVTTDAGSVMVGDPDSLFAAYSASGGTTTAEIVDNYYTRTFHYDAINKRDYKYVGGVVSVSKTVTPVVLDLDGDGKIEASNGQYLSHNTFSDNVALFDFYNNGFPVIMEWVGANDGLLCRPNADGSVNGSNLFGVTNGFENGYEEMASLDANNDGQLSGTELQGLKVWTDVNGDAIAQANELKSLDELGITSIKVSHNNYSSTFVRNGQTFKSFDWWPNAKEFRMVDMASVIGK